MTEKIIVPTADAVITPTLEKMYERRPSCFRHLNLRSGIYWHPVLGYRAQAAKMLERLAALAAARRLKTATGRELLDYVASEYDGVPSTDRTFAIGHIKLTRAAPPTPIPAGTIPKGTRFTRASFDALGVTFETAEYETLTDAFMPLNSTAIVTIPVRSTREGSHANTPLLSGSTTTNITFPRLFQNIVVSEFQAAGGSDGSSGADFDTYVRQYAKAFAFGQYGPTAAASRLGALRSTGVRHLLVYDYIPDGIQNVLVADSAWGSSDRLAAAAQQVMYDADLVGFGCRVRFGKIRNRVISVSATIALRDPNYLGDTTDVDLAVQTAVRSYFDDRADWNVWNTSALKAVIARAHPKIFNCTAAIVRDSSDGSTVSEILTADFAAEQFHHYLANNAMSLTYVGPT